MAETLAKHLPDAAKTPTIGGTSFWVRGPDELDADDLARIADEQGLIIEPGRINFLGNDKPCNYFRLGFSSIPIEKIEPGIKLLASLIDQQTGPKKI